MDALAQAAIAPIRSGMVVGLGTGRAAARCVRALGDRARAERLDITCVVTSKATEALARELGLRVVSLNSVDHVDYLFDGADEVDPQLRMIKGGGGAMTRERIVAHACIASGGRTTFVIDDTKLVPRLGHARLLPVEVLPDARELVSRELRRMGLTSTQRAAITTDNGGEVLDATLPAGSDLESLAAQLKALPGMIDHGLFLIECHRLLVEDAGGHVSERQSPRTAPPRA
jgi:ribose 5-phosphate isomerase A